MFYNTINLKGRTLKRALQTAKTQQEQIEYLFKHKHLSMATPYEVAQKLSKFGFDYPLTSVRRAMTNLTPDILVKTSHTRMGKYGKINYCWRLKNINSKT